MIDLLILLLKPALLIERGGWWLLLAPITIVAWLIDILICHTTWAMVAGWPHEGEVTISHTLERLCHPLNAGHPDYRLFVEVARRINRVSPTGRHIKVVADLSV